MIKLAEQPRLHAPADNLDEQLDRLHRMLTDRHAGEAAHRSALESLFTGLRNRRNAESLADWHALVARCRTHPLIDIVHQDPFTYRAFSKPRGYAGDAVMMDYIYGREDDRPAPESTPIGRAVFDYTTSAPASEGVRARRGFVADFLDQAASGASGLHVLSIAAGHLREADLSAAVRRRRFGRFVALDADAESLREVAACYGRCGVEPVHASFTRILAGRLALGTFDVIYSMGLLDYLNESIATRLVTHLFGMLRPGGHLVLANFLPAVRDVGYMEAFMDWNLVYRSRRDMVAMTMGVPEADVRSTSLFAEENRNIVFLDMQKM
jgi:SAM-dependent methyltransferase